MLFRIFYADFSRFNHEITRFLLFIRSYLVLNPSISCARARSLSPCASALRQFHLLFARHPRAFPWFSCTARAPKNHGPMSFLHSGLSNACDCPLWYPREQFRNLSGSVQHRPFPGPSRACSRYQMRIVAPRHPNLFKNFRPVSRCPWSLTGDRCFALHCAVQMRAICVHFRFFTSVQLMSVAQKINL